MGFSIKTSHVAHMTVLAMIPFMIVQIYSENLKILLITLGFEKCINRLNLIQLIAIVPTMWFFMINRNMSYIGFGVFKLVNELLVVAYLYPQWEDNPKDLVLSLLAKEFRRIKFRVVFSNQNKLIKSYLHFYLMCIPGIYGEY